MGPFVHKVTGSSSSRICLATIARKKVSTSSDVLFIKDSFSKRRYTANGHYWIRMTKPEKENVSYLEIGVTDHIFDTVIFGTIDSVSVPNIGDKNFSLQSSLALNWSGLKVGTGDELYHSVWENVEGAFKVEPFLPTKLFGLNVLEYNSILNHRMENYSDDWLLRISCNEREVEQLSVSLSSLRNQEDHDAFCLQDSLNQNDL